MIRIYEADSSIDAHLLRGLLEQRGIPVHIVGEHLLGAMGDLPAHGLIGVLVPEEHAQEARAVVHLYETGETGEDAAPDAPPIATGHLDPAARPEGSDPAPAPWWMRQDDVDWLGAGSALLLLTASHMARALPI